MSHVIVFTNIHTKTQLLSLFPLLYFISLIPSQLHNHTVDCHNRVKYSYKSIIHSELIYTVFAIK